MYKTTPSHENCSIYQEKLVKAQNQAIEQHPTQNLKTLALTGNLKISRISALRVYFQCDTSLALGNSIDRT
jgi:hypothetical protein